MDSGDALLPLHLTVLLFAAWNILRADHLGYKWMAGTVDVLDEKEIRKYHRRVWIGLVGMMVTGFLMFWPMRDYLLDRWQFLLKMSFVLALLGNGFAIGSMQKMAAVKRFKELSLQDKLSMLLSGTISTVGWVGAAITAFFIVEDF